MDGVVYGVVYGVKEKFVLGRQCGSYENYGAERKPIKKRSFFGFPVNLYKTYCICRKLASQIIIHQYSSLEECSNC